MPGYKAAKDRFRLLFQSIAVRNCKLKPLLVYHSENPLAIKGLSKVTLPVHFHSYSKA
jgi:hypothetical protein